MKPKSKVAFERLKHELLEILSAKFPGIGIEVEHSAKWDRPCVTFRSKEFSGLLPEERFQRLVAVIPTEFREQKMAGLVWVELAEGEALDAFLKLPRSEDIVEREAEIYAQLARAKLCDVLKEAMGSSPDRRCTGDFREMSRLLAGKRFTAEGIRDAKLLMIRYRAYCDCAILLTAQAELARLYADAA